MKRDEKFTDINVPQTAVNELANRPRYDITGERYGNTLSDDMFAIKNNRIPNRHTPESYEYFNQLEPSIDQTWAPAAGWGGLKSIPSLESTSNDPRADLIQKYPFLFGSDLVGRKKNVTGQSLPWEVYKDWGLTDDIMEFPENYTQEQLQWAEALKNANREKDIVNDLSTEGLRNEQLYGDNTMWDGPRGDYDAYIGDFVNYDRLSPMQLTQLAKMGVNRPTAEDINQVPEDNASDYLNFLVNAYRQRLGL